MNIGVIIVRIAIPTEVTSESIVPGILVTIIPVYYNSMIATVVFLQIAKQNHRAFICSNFGCYATNTNSPACFFWKRIVFAICIDNRGNICSPCAAAIIVFSNGD